MHIEAPLNRAVALLALGSALGACDGAGDGFSPGSDAGVMADGGSGGSAATPPVGKQLLVGGALTLRDMTSNGWIIYSDNATLNLHAAPIAGGAPRDIVALGDSFAVSVWGRVVFAWSNKNAAGVGQLTVWSSTNMPRVVASASLAPWVAASADGSSILFLDNVDAAGQGGDLVAAAGDGSSPHTILPALTGLSTNGCQALLGFAGVYALAAHCAGRATSPTLSSFAMPAWTRADLIADAVDAWSTDPAGTLLLTATSAGTMVVPLGGGLPTIVDPTGSTGQLTANGADAIYGTSTGALCRSPVVSPSRVTLVASGVAGLNALSPDGASALFYSKLDPVHLVSDLYLASALVPGTPVTLSAAETAGVFGDAFTSDSSHALYSTGVDTSTQLATLNALAVGGGVPRVLSQSAAEVWATLGGRVVFGDHYMWTGSRGHVDVRTVDTTGGADPVLIVSQADSELFLSPARDQVVYTWSLDASARAGIWVAQLPTP
jgi:hypothetical protein